MDTIRLYHSQDFENSRESYSTEKTLSKETINLDDVFNVVEEWLRGAGFHFNGQIGIIEDDF